MNLYNATLTVKLKSTHISIFMEKNTNLWPCVGFSASDKSHVHLLNKKKLKAVLQSWWIAVAVNTTVSLGTRLYFKMQLYLNVSCQIH